MRPLIKEYYTCAKCVSWKTELKMEMEKHRKEHEAQKEVGQYQADDVTTHEALDQLIDGLDCLICRFKGDNRLSLEIHIEAGHLNAKEMTCQGCNWQSTHLQTLVNHVKQEHTSPLKKADNVCLRCKL